MTSCLEHHKICNAECCKSFTIIINNMWVDKLKKGKFLKIHFPFMSMDKRTFYTMHGARYIRNLLIIKLDNFKVIKRGGRDYLKIYRTCDNLNNNLCELHPYGKPEVCKRLDENSAQTLSDRDEVYLTDNCMYKVIK